MNKKNEIINDKKNIIIGALTVLSCILLIALASGNSCPGTGKFDIPALAKNKVPHQELIKLASIHGISLETPIEKIDELIAKSSFECRSNERETKGKNGAARQEKFWRCNHKTFEGAELNIDVKDLRINRITRNGPASKEDIEAAITQVDHLKMKLENLQGFSINQTDRNMSFSLSYKKENNKATSMSFRTQYTPVRDPENPPEYDGMLNVSIIR